MSRASAGYPRRPTGAGRAALRAYRELPLSARLHLTLRWWSAPFPALEAQVPKSGRILEIGCGHGVLCTYLAVAAPGRSVVGVDIDRDKIEQATQVARGLAGVDLAFEVVASGNVPAGPWDAIAIVDMLYLLPQPAQYDLLAAAAAELAPDGVLLIKEMSTTPRWKARWNRMQETMSVSILGITARDSAPVASTGSDQPDPVPRFVFIPPEQMAGWLRDRGMATSLVRLDRHRLHPHHLITGRPGHLPGPPAS